MIERPETPKVPITCPDLDDLAELVKRGISDPVQRSRALALVEVIREKNRQLRVNATTWRKHALLCEREAGRSLDGDSGHVVAGVQQGGAAR